MPLHNFLLNTNKSIYKHKLTAPGRLLVAGILGLLLLATAGFTTASADSDSCVFAGPSLPDVRTTPHAALVFSSWDEARLERRAITRDGDLVAVKYWGCQHQGLQAVMLIPPYALNPEMIAARLDSLAAIAFPTEDYLLFIHALQANPLRPDSDSQMLQLPMDANTDTRVRYQVVGDSILLEIHQISN